MRRLFSEAWSVYRCFLLCWEPVSPGNRISRRAGPRADGVLSTPGCGGEAWNGRHRKPGAFQGVSGALAGADTAGHTCSRSAHSRTLAHAPRTPVHSAGLVPAPTASRARPSCRCGRRAASKRDGVAAGGPRGRAGGWGRPTGQEVQQRPGGRMWWRGAPAAGTRPLKAEEAASEQAVAPLEASTPGLTLKKPNCLLQREKATSCRRPCSGRNVSGLARGCRSRVSEGGPGLQQAAWAGRCWGDRQWVPVPSQGGRRARWARWSPVEKPTCQRWCWFSRLEGNERVFQGGTAHPLSHTNHCGEQRAADESPNKIWRGRQCSGLPEWLSFYKQLLFSLLFSSVGPFLSGLLSFLPKSQCVADCMGRMWRLGLSSLSSTALLSCLPSFFASCGKPPGFLRKGARVYREP